MLDVNDFTTLLYLSNFVFVN